MLGHILRTRKNILVIAVVSAIVVVLAPGPAADAGAPQSTLVNSVPSTNTPNVNNGVVHTIVQVGSAIVIGGTFSSVTGHGASAAVNRTFIAAFDQSTGALVPGFAPKLDGEVHGVTAGPSAGTVVVAGAFRTVNGVAAKSLAVLNVSTGALVPGFKAAALNGQAYASRLVGARLIVVGSFTTVGGVAHGGIVALNATTGALDPYIAIALTGHHNYDGTGSQGAVGGRGLDVSPDGTKAVVIGNFKNANGVLHDQVVMLTLGSTAGTINSSWNTAGYTARCFASLFDSYISDVDFSPDGSYFAIAATGGTGKNTDGTHALCDSATRWTTNATGADVQPVWADFTGSDTFWSIAVTGTAVYAGGHQRWVNNINGPNAAGEGAVPRPGIAALDPVNGMPFSWNPGRNPRGEGAYALLATSLGLYVGSDTDYIGNRKYLRPKIAFFPVSGGETIPSAATSSLPGKLYEAGPTNTGSPNSLTYHTVSGSTMGSTVTVPTSAAWSTTRGAFLAGGHVFFGMNGAFYQASFSGGTVGTPVVLNPYSDPAWKDVQTGSGQTYQGVVPSYYSALPNITGAFFTNGRLYYARSNTAQLSYRYFEPESGVIGAQEFKVTGGNWANTAGVVLSGSTLYYASKADGTLHTVPFVNGAPAGSGDAKISGPAVDGIDWRAKALLTTP
jgi:hypothetical protein